MSRQRSGKSPIPVLSLANRNMEQAIYLHRSCLPLAAADLGEMDFSGGVAHSECEGMCGV